MFEAVLISSNLSSDISKLGVDVGEDGRVRAEVAGVLVAVVLAVAECRPEEERKPADGTEDAYGELSG